MSIKQNYKIKKKQKSLGPITKELSGIAKYSGNKSDKELLVDALNKKAKISREETKLWAE